MSNKNKKLTTFSADLKLQDFADSKSAKGRFGKGKTLPVECLTESSESAGLLDDEIELQKRRRRSKSKNQEDPNHIYNDYHIDIWFLIAEHIRPEDVGRFAMICKKTDLVISSAKFWTQLYRNNYNPTSVMPPRLSPTCMVRLGGLRACVIRSLFFCYQPFLERLLTPIDLGSVLKHVCMGIWFKQSKGGNWIVCYRFRRKIMQRRRVFGILDSSPTKNLLERLNNVYENSEEGCSLLVITTSRFFPIPNFYSEQVTLNCITQPLTQNMRSYKLEMKFANYCNEIVTSITYDPVIQSRIYPWWHPDYYSFLV